METPVFDDANSPEGLDLVDAAQLELLRADLDQVDGVVVTLRWWWWWWWDRRGVERCEGRGGGGSGRSRKSSSSSSP
jgi:hypothetical protein